MSYRRCHQQSAHEGPYKRRWSLTKDGLFWGQAKGASGPRIQELALACLSHYAESSVVNCGKIAVVGGGPALGQIAASVAQEGRRYALETQLTRVLGILARDCPIRFVPLPLPIASP